MKILIRHLTIPFTLATLCLLSSLATADAFQRTEQREPCKDYSATKRPMFGDLHVHTSYSFDSFVSSQRNDPWAAYRYARGEAITLPDPDANQNIIARIQRPLDFTSVTDHAEFLGPINLCTQDSSKLAYWFPACIASRSEIFYVPPPRKSSRSPARWATATPHTRRAGSVYRSRQKTITTAVARAVSPPSSVTSTLMHRIIPTCTAT
jgi:hypothetical protein